MVDNRNPLYDFGDEGEGEAPTFNERWGSLPVEAPHFNLTPNVALVESTPKPLKQGTDPVTGRPDLKFVPVDDPWANTPKPIKRLLGVGGEERYQTWPERALRSGLSAPLDALTGRMQVNDPETGMPTDEAIRRSQDVASVGGPGGMMNLREEGILGSHGGNLIQPTPKVAAPFYSAVEHAVSNIKQDKMPADQWLGTLTNSKGVKPEELDWTGLKDFLKEKQDKTVDVYRGSEYKPNDKNHLYTTNDKELASKYGNVSKMKLDTSDYHVVDGKGESYSYVNPQAISEAQKLGKKGVVINNVVDNPNGMKSLGGDKPSTVYVSFNKSTVDPKISKQEVQDYVNANKVGLKEVNKGELKFNKDHPYAIPEVIKAAKQAGDTPGDLELTLSNDGNAYRALTKKFPELREDENWGETVAKAVFGGDSMPKGTTKYSQYQLPGGENYKEMLMTLPDRSEAQMLREEAARRGYPDSLKEWPDKEFAQRYRDKVINAKDVDTYKSSHWPEDPNVLAHVRTNDRNIIAPGETTPKKSLHIEEIQSDWHQEGRNKGYSGNRNRYNELNDKYIKGKATIDEIDEMHKLGKSFEGVPDAPFKKTWHELALKRMIREAAEKGYDRLSWTPGGANKTNPKVLGQTGEQAEKADRGLKKFYDEIIPQAIEKIGKEHGVKVKQAKTEGTYDEHKVNKDSYDPPYRLEKKDSPVIISRHKTAQEAWDKAEELTQRPVHYIDIPESLKNQALGKGFPLFSSGGHFLNPIPGNPHEQVDNSHHVPYGAGASNTPTGFPVNIDKRIPKYDDKLKLPNGQPADLHKYLTIHEIEEYKAMKAGIPYHKAHHDIATPMEKKAVESDGVSWKEYEHIMDGYLKKTEEGGYKNLPPRLYTKPYPHSRSLKMDHGEDNGKED